MAVAFTPRPGHEGFVLNAIFRHGATATDGVSLGFQFVGLEARPDGPALIGRLARVVTDFQRAGARRQSRRRYRR
jgi:hypothetical protein